MMGIIGKLFNRQNNYYIELNESPSQQNGNQGTQQSPSQQQQQQQSVAAKQQKQQSTSSPSSQPSSTGMSAQQASVAVQSNGQGTMANQQLQQEQAFAPTWMTPQAKTPRRRPGANMSEYMDLARQANLPRMQ